GKTLLTVCARKGDANSKVGYFKLWDTKADKVLDFWQGDKDAWYERVAVSDNGATAAVVDVGAEDNKWRVHLWDLGAKKNIASPGFHTNTVNGMAFTRDGSAVATASLDKTVKFWGVKSGKEVSSIATGETHMGLAFSPDGRRMATAAVLIQ